MTATGVAGRRSAGTMSTPESAPAPRDEAALGLAEAIELAAAWTARVADDRGIRTLLIKGPGLSHHGIRPHRTSADVDVLVEPDRFDEYCAAIAARGWSIRPHTEVHAEWASHSVTLLRDGWPCDLDVHRCFPGFLAETGVVFDALWAARESLTLAHRDLAIPSRNATLLIALLHQLRDGESRINRAELDSALGVHLTDTERGDLVELASATGALEPVRALLPRLGVDPTLLPPPVESPQLRAWRARVAADASGVFAWVMLLRHTPPRRRIGVLGRALWPPRRDVMINHPGTPDRWWPMLHARVARLGRGIRSVPASVRGALVWRRGGVSRP